VSAAPERILTVNVGSSSLKLRVVGSGDEILCERQSDFSDDDDLGTELQAMLADCPPIDAAGHRVVHGGPDFTGPTVLSPGVEEELEQLADLAPLHNPPAVAAMRALESLRPGLPTVACFDTAFHAEMPVAASTYAIPASWSERWPLRRYGFHGLSHAYASRRAAELLGRPPELRLVTAHLGAGASLAAVADGRSVDTTMGFSPLEGLVMATRSGSLDPGLLLWVQRHGDLGPERIERALDREAGLMALSGRSGDMRELIAGADAGDERCALAFDVYLHRLTAGVASMAAALAGIDGLVFTGGVGEGSGRVRSAACRALTFLGVPGELEETDAGSGDRLVSPASSTVAVAVVAAREDVEIAHQVRAALGSAPSQHGRPV
jgi:acetate kinase